jgi:ribonuclease HI
MYFDGSLNLEGAGAGVLFISLQGDHLKYVLQIHYKASNNGAEYKALIHGLRITVSLGIKRLIAYGDSKVVIDQVNKACDNNVAADVLSKLGSKRALVPASVFSKTYTSH